MKRVYSIGLTALAGLVLVSLAPQGALAQDLELAAGHDQYSPTPIVMELDRAGFYTVATERLNEDVMFEAISDFEHHIGWPETGRPSPAVLGALREYNAQSGVGSTQFWRRFGLKLGPQRPSARYGKKSFDIKEKLPHSKGAAQIRVAA